MLEKNKKILGYYIKFVGNDTIKGFDTIDDGKEWLIEDLPTR
jgi:hypothetical protein